MDDMKAMMQNELRQALTGLMPPPTAIPALGAAIPPTVVAPITVNLLVVDALPTNHDNTGGQPLNAAKNAPAVENYMVEKAKKKSLELAQDLESK